MVGNVEAMAMAVAVTINDNSPSNACLVGDSQQTARMTSNLKDSDGLQP